MSAAGLRREADAGRLAVMKIAGKFFTTMAAIEAMKELCLVPARRAPGSDAEGSRGPSLAAVALTQRLSAALGEERRRTALRALEKSLGPGKPRRSKQD